MSRRQPHTTNSRITSVLRRLWMWSRERAAALKRAKQSCEACGSKQKIEVHHRRPCDMQRIIAVIREELLQHEDRLTVLCAECHEKEHGGNT